MTYNKILSVLRKHGPVIYDEEFKEIARQINNEINHYSNDYELIKAVCCEYYGINVDNFKLNTRKYEYVITRQMFVALCKGLTKITANQIYEQTGKD